MILFPRDSLVITFTTKMGENRMRAVLLLVITSIVVGGCATSQPQRMLRKNVPESEVQQDKAACQAQAMAVNTADWEYRGTFMEGVNIQQKQNKILELCMIAKGYK